MQEHVVEGRTRVTSGEAAEMCGVAQIWYIVPAAKHAEFLEYLGERVTNGVGLSYIKQLLLRIPGDVMAALDIVRIVQKPLQAVITLPVSEMLSC